MQYLVRFLNFLLRYFPLLRLVHSKWVLALLQVLHFLTCSSSQACVLVSPVVFKLQKEVIHRDGVVYIIAVIILLALLLITRSWGVIVALLLLVSYAAYLFIIAKDTRAFQKVNHNKQEPISLRRELSIALFTLIVIGVATFFLTREAINFAEAVGISPLIIGFTIVATATSFPDGVISVVNAKKGLADDAISNVYGSNTFNIFVGLGLPLLVGALLYGPAEIVFTRIEIIIALVTTAFITHWFMDNDHMISKKEAIIMISMFVAFVSYVILLAFLGH